MRRCVAIILALIMIFSLASCSSIKPARAEGVISPTLKDSKPELTILINSEDYASLGKSYLVDYFAKFKRDFGVDIKLEAIKTNKNTATKEGQEEYLQKLFLKSMTEECPALIFSDGDSLMPLIEQQAVVDLRGKVGNIDKVYDGLLADKIYYIPLGVDYNCMAIKRTNFEELGVDEPDINWMPKDYYAFRNKWISNNKILFNSYEYYRAFQQFIDLESLYKAEEKKVTLNTPEVRQKINELRSYIFGGNYQLRPGYKYENYYNMLYEGDSKEWKDDIKARSGNDNLLDGTLAGCNLLRAKNLQKPAKEYIFVKDPDAVAKGTYLGSFGFLVNKNGKHLELAYEFINGLLSNEVQMAMFEYEDVYNPYYPVNKEIEADILKSEAEAKLDPKATQLKAFALQELKAGKCRFWTKEKTEIEEHGDLLYKDMTKLVLADNPYSDEQLQAELKRMEDKFNIYIKE